MGRRGPQKTPTAVLQRRGSRALGSRKSEPRVECLAPPKPVGLDGLAGAAWDTYERMLVNMGVLAPSDGLAFEALCRCYAEWHDLGDDIAANGRVEFGDDGTTAMRPEVKMYQDADRRLKQWLSAFGLSPASRAAVKVIGKPERNIEAVT